MLKFVRMSEAHLETVLRWRVQPDVTRFMITDVENDLPKQKEWFRRIQNDSRCRYWMISYSDRWVGVINLADIDLTHRRCSWGFYVGEREFRTIGFLIPPYLYNYVFDRLDFHKVVGEVMDGNSNILKIHEMHGCRRVGTQRDQVFKYGRFHDLHLIELLASDWRALKDKYSKFVADFES